MSQRKQHSSLSENILRFLQQNPENTQENFANALALLKQSLEKQQKYRLRLVRHEEREKRYRLLFDKSPIGILHIDRHGNIVDCNEPILEMFGSDKEQILQLNIFHDIKNQEIKKNLSELFTGESVSYTGDYLSLSGKQLLIKAEATPLFSDDEISGGIITIEDITEKVNTEKKVREQNIELQRRNEEIKSINSELETALEQLHDKHAALEETSQDLKQSREKYYHLLQDSPFGIITCDVEGNIGFVNHSALEILASPSEKATKEINLLSYRPLQLAKISAKIVRCIEKKVKIIDEHEYISKWGKEVDVRIHYTPLVTKNNQVEGVLLMLEDVKSRKKMLQALMESEERYRVISEMTSDFVYSLHISQDKDLTIEWFTGPIKQITGYSAYEVKRIDFMSVIYKDDINIFQTHISHVLQGSSDNAQFRINTKNNHVIWIESFLRPIKHQNSRRIHRIIGAVSDITKDMETAELIRKSEKRFRKLFEQSIDAIFLHDFEGRIIDVNSSACKLLDYTKEELLKRNIVDIVIATKEQFSDAMQTLREKGIFNAEVKFYTSNDEVIYTEVNSNILDTDNQTIQGVVRNITERKKAEKALKESEDKFRKITEQSADGIVLTDTNGKILVWNKAQEKITGIMESVAVGRNLWDIQIVALPFHQRTESRRKKLQEIITNILKTGESKLFYKAMESKIIDSNKNEKYIQVIVFPIKTGNKIMLGSVTRDITASQAIKNDLQQAKNLAETASRAKSEFLATMSHEIRTPMNAILGFSEILKEKLARSPEFIEYVSGIQSSGKGLLNLINDILDLSKIEAGRLEIKYHPVNFYDLIEEIRQIFKIRTMQKGLDFVVEIDKKLPEALIIDETRLRQVLFNLVGNAIKFTHAGSVSIIVDAIMADDESAIDLIIRVKDTGIGIPEKQQDIIFEPFRQKEGQSSRKFGGTGLGLSITKRLVEMMNGNIRVESVVNIGTTFSVKLPDVRIASIKDTSRKQKNIDIRNIKFEQAKILLVEDNDANRKVISNFLESYNFIVLEALNGKQAVEIFEKNPPDLVLMDIQMPIMDGYEATKILKQKQQHAETNIPVVAITAITMKAEDEEKKHIFDGYLRKPITKEQLTNELTRFLVHSKKTSEKKSSYQPPDVNQLMSNADETIDYPDELIALFGEQLLPAYDEIQNTFSFNRIKKFAEKIKIIGETYNCAIMIDYGSIFMNHAKSFNITGINQTLNHFNRLSEIIMREKP